MPVLSINTNLATASIPEGFVKSASELVGNLTGKPEGKVSVFVNSGVIGCLGSTDPFIYAEFQSIGGFSSPNNVAKAISEFFTDKLGVPGTRIYLKFTAPDPKLFAQNGETKG